MHPVTYWALRARLLAAPRAAVQNLERRRSSTGRDADRRRSPPCPCALQLEA
jgi:hypothetical protein